MSNRKKILYAVMRLSETVNVDYYGQIHQMKIAGVRGFIPVFETIEDAEEYAQDGKYQILEISV